MSEFDDLLDPGVQKTSESGGNYGQPATLPNATATLVLGIISIVGCITYGVVGLICGIIAMVLHKKDKQLYLSNTAKYEHSYKTARAGYICAIIGVCISAVFFLFMIIYIVFIISMISSIPHI